MEQVWLLYCTEIEMIRYLVHLAHTLRETMGERVREGSSAVSRLFVFYFTPLLSDPIFQQHSVEEKKESSRDKQMPSPAKVMTAAAGEGEVYVSESTCVQEFMHDQGWSDGFPLVAPTPARVAWMLQGTRRDPNFLVGKCPPTYSKATVYSIAVNAVMAGCERRHFRWVIAGVEAMLQHQFNLHGVHATTMGALKTSRSLCMCCSHRSISPVQSSTGATPAIILNGPGRVQDGFNHLHGAMGSGHRANACVGRALKLVLQNIGGARIGAKLPFSCSLVCLCSPLVRVHLRSLISPLYVYNRFDRVDDHWVPQQVGTLYL